MTYQTIADGFTGHFVRRQFAGNHLSGKCLKEHLQHAINCLLPSADTTTVGSLLRRCANAKALSEGRKIHTHIVQCGYISDTYLGNNLIQMYGKCARLDEAISAFSTIRKRNIYSHNTLLTAYAENGQLHIAEDVFQRMPQWDAISYTAMLIANAQHGEVERAKSLFERMPLQDTVAWNAMITAYAQTGHYHQAMKHFLEMDSEGIHPDKVSFLSVAQAFTFPSSVYLARRIHSAIECEDFDLHHDVVLGTSLVDMYGKCGRPDLARSVFGSLAVKNVVTWTAMVAGYAQNRCLTEAEEVFSEMPEKNTVSWNAMVTGYVQNGDIPRAREVFEGMDFPDTNSWNIMISAHAQAGECTESLRLFMRMIVEGVRPDKFTYVSVLDACSGVPALAVGRQIHKSILQSGTVDTAVGNALANMYAKCGHMTEAREVFEHVPHRNALVTWNTMIAMYSKNGFPWESLHMFNKMHLLGVQPDDITFVSMLFACSHGGFYEEGVEYFVCMQVDFGIQPVRDHYMCVIDLLSRAGQLREAEEFVRNMPVQADDVAVRTILSACRTHGSRGDICSSNSESSELVLLSNLCNLA